MKTRPAATDFCFCHFLPVGAPHLFPSRFVVVTNLLQDNVPMGVAGKVELLNSRVISSQPIVSFDWSPDREGLCCLSCLDQTVRVFIVTKLGKF